MPFRPSFLAVSLLLVALPASAFDGLTFESKKTSQALDCARERVVPPVFDSDGEMFSCIGGRAETVKLFINAAKGSDEIKNMKLIWNEWTKDIGDGIGTDRLLAKAWVSEVAALYAPDDKEAIISAFFDETPYSLSTQAHMIEYEHQVGPAINQHLLVLTPKGVAKEAQDRVAAYASDFDQCKALVAATVTYTASDLSGDGDPVKESGYDSFMIKGQNDDLFFCELHDDGKYRIKAALGGNYPFRYIDEGKL